MSLGWVSIVSIFERKDARAETLKVRETAIKAIFLDQRRVSHVALPAHVPFAKMPRGIAGPLKVSGQ